GKGCGLSDDVSALAFDVVPPSADATVNVVAARRTFLRSGPALVIMVCSSHRRVFLLRCEFLDVGPKALCLRTPTSFGLRQRWRSPFALLRSLSWHIGSERQRKRLTLRRW